jgi:hypothetical protein
MQNPVHNPQEEVVVPPSRAAEYASSMRRTDILRALAAAEAEQATETCDLKRLNVGFVIADLRAALRIITAERDPRRLAGRITRK